MKRYQPTFLSIKFILGILIVCVGVLAASSGDDDRLAHIITPVSVKELAFIKPFKIPSSKLAHFPWFFSEKSDDLKDFSGYLIAVKAATPYVLQRAMPSPVLCLDSHVPAVLGLLPLTDKLLKKEDLYVMALVPEDYLNKEQALIWFDSPQLLEQKIKQTQKEQFKKYQQAIKAGVQPFSRKALKKALERGGEELRFFSFDELQAYVNGAVFALNCR